MSNYMDEARAMRASIARLAEGASDEKIIDNKSAFPFWNGNGIDYAVGDILQYQDDVYKVIQPHRSQTDWTPDAVPALFVKISLDEYPEWVQPTGAHDAYAKGAKCSHNGKHWISDYDANIWEPGVYGWSEVVDSDAD